jgi:hypothetical protein
MAIAGEFYRKLVASMGPIPAIVVGRLLSDKSRRATQR